MKIETRWQAIWRVGRVIGIVVGIASIVIVVIGLRSGWSELRDYGFAFMLAGVIAWVVGGGSMMGTMSLGGNPRYQFARTVSPNTTQDRMRQDAKDRASGGNFLLLMFIIGVLLIGISLLLMAVGGPPA